MIKIVIVGGFLSVVVEFPEDGFDKHLHCVLFQLQPDKNQFHTNQLKKGFVVQFEHNRNLILTYPPQLPNDQALWRELRSLKVRY